MSSRKVPRSPVRSLLWRTDFVGIAMMVSGLFFLLVNFKIVPASDFVLPRVLGILFIMGGLIFLFFSGAGGWLSWFVIPAGALFTSGLVTLVFGLNQISSLGSGSLFSTGIGLTFLAVFLTRRNHWWALLPAGFFIGLGAWAELGSNFRLIGWHPVSVIFCLGISFLLVYTYSVQRRMMRWSLLTGAIIVAISFFYLLAIFLARWSMLWPIVLLLASVLILLWVMFAKRARRGEN